jgi:ABC-type transporter MlaC component
MPFRRYLIQLVLLASLPFFGVSAGAATETAPDDLVKSAVSLVTSHLTNDRALIETHPGYLDQLLSTSILPLIDTRQMGKKVLGKYWRRASSEQQSLFLEAFRRKLLKTYAGAFRAYDDQPVHFLDTRYNGHNKALVPSLIELNGKPPLTVDYRLYHSAQWRVDDVTIAGMSLVKSFRDQVQAMIQENGFSQAMVKLSKEYPDDRPVVRLGSDSWAPYAGKQLLGDGIATELVTTALSRLGYRVEVEFMPWMRVLESTNSGEIQGVLSTWPGQQDDKWLLSDAYLHGQLRFIKSKSSDFEYQGKNHLKITTPALRLGIYSEINYGPWLDNIDRYFAVEPRDYCSQLFRDVANNNLDLALVDEWVASTELASNPTIAEHLVLAPGDIARTSMHLAINRQLSNASALITGFNHMLQQMKQDGSYQQILEKHQYPYHD